MPGEATSQHLRNAHELLLLVPLRGGFVQQPDRLTSYASRLRAVLALLFKPTQSAVERTLMPSESSIDKLQNLYHFHYGVVDQLERPHLFLSASFDSSWENYFHNLVDNVGDFLDVIFFHCENFDGRSCDDGYEAFAGFVREHQVQSGIFYSALPDMTADDLRLLRKVARGAALNERILPVDEEIKKEKALWQKEGTAARGPEFELDRIHSLERLVMAMWDLRELFPELEEIKGRTARGVYEAAAAQVAGSYLDERDPETGKPSSLLLKLKLPREVQGWLLGLKAVREQRSKKKQPARAQVELAPAQLANIQGNILVPYALANHGLMALMQLGRESIPALLTNLGQLLTTANEQDADLRVNVAFTFAGLRRAGVSDGVLDLFPKDFREGMEARAGVLGDIGYPNHPDYWAPLARNHLGDGGQNGASTFALSQVDFVLFLQAPAQPAADDHKWQPRHPLWDVFRRTLSKLGGEPIVLRVEPLRRSEQDHFGLPHRDLESQPVARVRCAGRELEPPGPSRHYDNTIALGELLLGYPDKRDKRARCADETFNRHSAQLFKDGSFLVVRKLEQDSAAFEAFLAAHKNGRDSQDALLAALTGRDAKGRTLAAPSGSADPGNDFNYDDDPHGKGCPLHAHMRRTNPRTAATPRLMRRSFPYGSDYHAGNEHDDRARGLMFMAYNASIAEQFETVQRWVSGGNSTGLLSARSDLLGGGTPRAGTPLAPVHDGKPSDGLTAPAQAVIKLCWGAYLFAPSRAGLAFIAKAASERPLAHGERVLAAERKSRYAVQGRDAGVRLLQRLDAIKDPAEARGAWKMVLEESAYAPEAEAVWEELRARGTPHRTPYGVLIADLRLAREILCDDGAKYSVRKYWQRLRDVLGEHYLGLDVQGPAAGAHEPHFARARGRALRSLDDHLYEQRLARGPSYEALAELPNRSIQELITQADAYQLAYTAATTFLGAQARFFDARDLARYVVASAARSWFDLPRDDSELLAETRALLQHFIVISRYCFYPHPEPWQQADVNAAGKALKEASARSGLDSPIARKLSALGYTDPENIRLAMMGALVGFVPPAVAHIATIIPRWFENGDLHAWATMLAKCNHEHADKLLLGPLLETLSDYPVPTIIYRAALEGSLCPGEDVVIGLQAVTREAQAQGGDKPERWLFGGAHGGLRRDRGAVHGCPARDPAIAIMLGTLAAVTRFAPLTREGALRFSHGEATQQVGARPGSQPCAEHGEAE